MGLFKSLSKLLVSDPEKDWQIAKQSYRGPYDPSLYEPGSLTAPESMRMAMCGRDLCLDRIQHSKLSISAQFDKYKNVDKTDETNVLDEKALAFLRVGEMKALTSLIPVIEDQKKREYARAALIMAIMEDVSIELSRYSRTCGFQASLENLAKNDPSLYVQSAARAVLSRLSVYDSNPIDTVYLFVVATDDISDARSFEIADYAMQKLRDEGDHSKRFRELYEHVARDQVKVIRSKGMAHSPQYFSESFIQWLKSMDISISSFQAVLGKQLFLYGGNAKDPTTDKNLSWGTFVYFKF